MMGLNIFGEERSSSGGQIDLAGFIPFADKINPIAMKIGEAQIRKLGDTDATIKADPNHQRSSGVGVAQDVANLGARIKAPTSFTLFEFVDEGIFEGNFHAHFTVVAEHGKNTSIVSVDTAGRSATSERLTNPTVEIGVGEFFEIIATDRRSETVIDATLGTDGDGRHIARVLAIVEILVDLGINRFHTDMIV